MCRSPQYFREEEEPGDGVGCHEFTEGVLHQANFSQLTSWNSEKLMNFGKSKVHYQRGFTLEVLGRKSQMEKQVKNRSVRRPQSESRYRRRGLCWDGACEIKGMDLYIKGSE